MRPHFSPFHSLLALSLFALLTVPPTPRVDAGCGCEKPPPLPAAIRPHATYAGATVTVFDSKLLPGAPYRVTFTNSDKGKKSTTVDATATTQRDLADGRYKVQLNVPVPALPPGPASITVRTSVGGALVTSLDDKAFTLVPAPVAVPAQPGDYRYKDFQAAVGRDGTVYLSLDLSQVQLPLVVQAQAKGYPLRFGNTDVVFYNTQGFLMQTLTQGIPGLYTIQAAASSADSDLLRYSRHEFATHYVQHGERQAHQLDPADANWHHDGTPHIDHNRLVLALAGKMNTGSAPTPGATPLFELVLQTYSFFHHGLVGASSVSAGGNAQMNSFNSQNKSYGSDGDILSNGPVTLADYSQVAGDAAGSTISVATTARLHGATLPVSQAVEFLPVAIPKNLPTLGNIALSSGATQTLTGPGSFLVSGLSLSGGQLTVDNARGPVTLYLTGPVNITGQAAIVVTDPNPEKFAIYMATPETVKLAGQGNFYGVVYAPTSVVQLSGQAEYFGAYVGKDVQAGGQALIHYDSALRGEH